MATVAGLAVKSVHEPALSGVSAVWLGDAVRVELVQVQIHACSALLSTTHSWMLGAQACPEVITNYLINAVHFHNGVLPTLISHMGTIGVIQVGHVAEASKSCAPQSAARYWYWTSHCCVTVE